MKLPVTKTMDEKYYICFEESDIRQACKNTGCSQEMIEDCISNFKDNPPSQDSTCCFVELVSYMKIVGEYELVQQKAEE